jgi:zinc transport system substrate-binding protein
MKKNNLLLLFGLIIILAIVFFVIKNTQKTQSPVNHNRLQVVGSFYPMYFFASQIGGDQANVFNITPAAAEPHDYEPTTQDIARIENADMLVLNGGSLEAWGNKIKDDLQGKHTVIVTAGDSLVTKQMVENGETIRDPHVWLDPILAKQEVANIEKGFEHADPKDAAYFQANAKSLNDKLDQLNTDYTQGLQNCQQKDFITSHAAFAYLGEQYRIHQVPIAGVSPDEEPSSQKLAEIADLVKQKNIKIIFFESLVSPKLSETIANETGAKTMVLDPIEGISDDDMKAGHTYLTVMKDNLRALQTALECNK